MTTRRFILVTIAVLTLAVATTSLLRTVKSYYGLDFPVTWLASGVVVNGVPSGTSAQTAGLVPGDRIIAVDGVAVSHLEDPLLVLAVGKERVLTVASENGEVRSAVLHPPPPDIDMIYLARTAVGTMGLVCALFAVLTTKRREASSFLLLGAAALLLGATPHRIAASNDILRVLHRSAGTALPFLMFHFFATFPERKVRLHLLDLITVIAVGTVGTLAAVPEADVWFPALASGLRILFGLAIIYGIVILTRRRWLADRDARIRRQIEWVALGMFVGLAPYCVLVILPRWLGVAFEPLAWLAVLPIAAVPLGFVAALTEYRLWDIEPITRDSVSATLVGATGGLIFIVTNHLLLQYAGGLESLRNLFAFATGVLLVVLLQPVRLRVERFLDQWLHHGRPTPRWLLTNSTRDLASAIDSRESLMRLSQALRDGLELNLVATYVAGQNATFHRVTSSGEALPNELTTSDLEVEFPSPGEQPLAHAGYAERILLERSDTVHGVLYLGLRRGLLPLGTEGREVVSSFAAQAALGLESARRLEDLRRHAEEYRILHANTQRIIESSAAGILVCDASGRILSANSEAAGIFAIDSIELVALGLDELLELPAGWSPTLPVHAVNAESRTLASPPRRVVMTASVLELDSGSFNGRVVVIQDLTEMRDLQDRMREQERLASLGRLASGLAHEINTPLTGISSYAQMLATMTDGSDPRAEIVRKLEDQSFRVSRIVANLHEAVRGTHSEPTAIDLRLVAHRAACEASRSLGANQRLEIETETEPIMAWGVSGPVELAVGNLVRNALEAAPGGCNAHLTVTVAAPWAEVVVEDDGPGVPEHLQTKVFEPFYTTKSERGGTGMGLAITRDMIVQLGGEVTIEGSSRGGAKATIRLQLWKESAASS